jgi:DNA modification methylase
MSASSRKSSSLLDTRTIFCGDNLDQLRKLPDACIDLIYIDPPFNSNRTYEVFWGESKEKRSFDDRHESTRAYIEFMRPRCVELAHVLKKTGSFYYHCDWHASHYVKVMLDQIFGENHFRNEIVWCYTGPGSPGLRQFMRKHDVIFWYSNSREEWTFNADAVRIPHNPKTKANYKPGLVGSGFVEADHLIHEKGKVPEDWWLMAIAPRGKEYLGYPTQKPLALLDRIIKASSNPNDIVLDAFCGCGTVLVAAQNLGRQWIGIDISPTACRVMAKRLRDVCRLPEDEKLWRAGRGFVVRDLPWSEQQLRKIPPFEFENWAVIALGGIPNKAQVGDMGIDGRIYPVSSMPTRSGKSAGELDFMDAWYPIQVKQKDKVGRPDIDQFETAMLREKRTKGFFVSFEFSSDALREIDAFFRREHCIIVPLTVQEILEESLARKLA